MRTEFDCGFVSFSGPEGVDAALAGTPITANTPVTPMHSDNSSLNPSSIVLQPPPISTGNYRKSWYKRISTLCRLENFSIFNDRKRRFRNGSYYTTVTLVNTKQRFSRAKTLKNDSSSKHTQGTTIGPGEVMARTKQRSTTRTSFS
ncbi:uncharacterized protein LOC112603027 [Melanaphis sacchari]|uniref:uncharacterized protein LOC112603027 n=1 Tax=Melanaphis sacchari TaxID=742174 RepID=UPI000DC13396|nr:uncharacterized protein LOC112603027 [Melanaphis sacchari]